VGGFIIIIIIITIIVVVVGIRFLHFVKYVCRLCFNLVLLILSYRSSILMLFDPEFRIYIVDVRTEIR
jgi:purine-cytosine permease-like protein